MTATEFVATHVTFATGCRYDGFIRSMEAQLGRHDPSAYKDLLLDHADAERARAVMESQCGPFGLMIFGTLPVGMLFILDERSMKACQYLIGNPLTAFSMMRNDIRAGLYAPLRVLIHADRTGAAVVEYDLPSSLFGSIGDARVEAVGKALDEQLEAMLRAASQEARAPEPRNMTGPDGRA